MFYGCQADKLGLLSYIDGRLFSTGDCDAKIFLAASAGRTWGLRDGAEPAKPDGELHRRVRTNLGAGPWRAGQAGDRERRAVFGFVGPFYGEGFGGPFYGGGFYGPGPFFDAGLPARVDEVSCETTFMLRGDKVVGFTLRGDDCS
jgi:hypothetical protein